MLRGASAASGHRGPSGRRVLLVQTTIPEYRVPLFERLAHRLPAELRIVAGTDYFDRTVVTAHVSGLPVTPVRNRFLGRRRLLWQSLPWRAVAAADAVIAELNPRILSTWAVLAARRLLRRPTILWGHAWPRRGRRSRSEVVRHAMRRLGDAVIVYSETEAGALRRRMPGRLIAAAPNALYALEEQPASVTSGRMANFVFVGRLVESKKPGLLLAAFSAAQERLPVDTELVFVGDGPLRRELEAAAARSPAGSKVRFLGEVARRDALAAVYADALASVIPGYAGLSLTQSLWFGVAGVIARDEPHSPEIEAAVEGENAIFVESDSVDSLAAALVRLEDERDLWIARRQAIARACAERYSLERTAEGVAATVRKVLA